MTASDRPRRTVFLSYASEDRAAAQALRDALPRYGLEVWYDESDLVGGDVWDQKIRRQIHECDYFMPVISANTEVRREGYFRREWRLAVERTLDMADDFIFLVPVVIDETTQVHARVPEKFLTVPWLRVPGGQPIAALEALCQRLIAGRSSAVLVQKKLAEQGGAEGNLTLPRLWSTRLFFIVALLLPVFVAGYALGGALYLLMAIALAAHIKRASTRQRLFRLSMWAPPLFALALVLSTEASGVVPAMLGFAVAAFFNIIHLSAATRQALGGSHLSSILTLAICVSFFGYVYVAISWLLWRFLGALGVIRGDLATYFPRSGP